MDSITEGFMITLILFVVLGFLEIIIGILYQIKFNKKYKSKRINQSKPEMLKSAFITRECSKNKDR